MKLDLSFWRFVIFLSFAKSGSWGKGNDTYYLHIGTFTDGKSTAMKIVLFPVCLMIGFVKF